MDNYSPAGLTRRFFASLLDTAVVLLTIILPIVAALVLGGSIESLMQNKFVIALFTGLLILFAPLITFLFSYLISKNGGTPGKRLLGMKILNYENNSHIDFKTAFFRTIMGYTFSTQFFGLGFWRVIKNNEKLGWHDELFNTKVVKINK